MRMDSLEIGKEFTIKGFERDNKPIFKKLSAMGLKEGTKGTILMKNGRVYLLRLNGSRLIIDRDLASYIEVA
jgi:Fe2+ transport system protein FeoA